MAFAIVIAATFLLVFMRCAGRPYLAALMTLWGAVASAPSWGVRPQIFSLLLASTFLVLLEVSEQTPEPGVVDCRHSCCFGSICTPDIRSDWPSSHSSCSAKPWRRPSARVCGCNLCLDSSGWLLVFAACLVLVPLNPNGLRIYTYPFETLRSAAMHRFIQEWFSPNFHDPMYMPLAADAAGAAGRTGRLPTASPTTQPGCCCWSRSPRHCARFATSPFWCWFWFRCLPIWPKPACAGGARDRFLERGRREPGRQVIVVNVLVLVAFTAFTVVRVRQVVTTQDAD